MDCVLILDGNLNKEGTLVMSLPDPSKLSNGEKCIALASTISPLGGYHQWARGINTEDEKPLQNWVATPLAGLPVSVVGIGVSCIELVGSIFVLVVLTIPAICKLGESRTYWMSTAVVLRGAVISIVPVPFVGGSYLANIIGSLMISTICLPCWCFASCSESGKAKSNEIYASRAQAYLDITRPDEVEV